MPNLTDRLNLAITNFEDASSSVTAFSDDKIKTYFFSSNKDQFSSLGKYKRLTVIARSTDEKYNCLENAKKFLQDHFKGYKEIQNPETKFQA